MSIHFHSHLNSAVAILKKYKGDIPFHLYLKKYFSANKKFGSKDRKQITSLCYNYFRLGHAAKNISTKERIVLAEQLVNGQLSMDNKQLTTGNKQLIENIFPFQNELSGGIDPEKFNQSFLIQPKLFLRIRPGYKNKVIGKLAGAGIPYELLTESCLTLPNSSKINEVVEIDKEAVVQDYNSQKVGEVIKQAMGNWQPATGKMWDCCAASGGKSLMAYDIDPTIQLTVSDKRESILINLKERFERAGIKHYKSFIADLSNSKFKMQNLKQDLIIADVPCTGSGTWARTPEQLFHFSKSEIEKYSNLQKQILGNIVEHLKPGATLLYVTCSVFKKENEEVVNFVIEKFNLKLVKMELLKGYEMQADTLFAALLTSSVT